MSEPQKKSSFLFKVAKVVLVLFLVAVLAIGGVGVFVLDGKYELSRETVIKAPPAAVYAQVGDLNQWPNWLPFSKHDPSVQTTVDKATGVGAHQTWTSKNGNGELTFTKADEDSGVAWDMNFDKKYDSKGSMTFTREGDDTRVVWRMTGQNNNFVGKWLALAMPTMVGPMFEEGLTDLKNKVEAK
jgi:uncharacterized protein YndB with AHSA1/START domain